MVPFTLKQQFEISDIGAASGLVFHAGMLYLISDSSGFLHCFDVHTQRSKRIALWHGASQNIPKFIKPDFESLVFKAQKLHAFGSGSTPARNRCLVYDLQSKQTEIRDLSAWYSRLRSIAEIPETDFNIEGVISIGEAWLMFQRGNGAAGKNGIFRLESESDPNPEFIPIALPEIEGVPASFTDAVMVGNSIYFLAAAENTTSTYLDGEILGSLLGIMNFETFEIEKTILISRQHKFEGLTYFHENKTEITFLLCEDSDSDTLQSVIYALNIPKPAY
ncbi:hypothetical protein [Flavobacterium sp.]|uniref:DUF6929 family protein n=1 Tax=Flavobacterium sp. TaxID=239 RepID=UPI002630A618|nr:hypothetical protein [Flavobacterium sp.]